MESAKVCSRKRSNEVVGGSNGEKEKVVTMSGSLDTDQVMGLDTVKSARQREEFDFFFHLFCWFN